MAWVDREEYEQLRTDNLSLNAENVRLQAELALKRTVGDVVVTVEGELRGLIDGGQILSEAASMAVAAVVSSEKPKLVEQTKDELLATEAERYAQEFHAENATKIRNEVDAELIQNGGYDQERRRVTEAEKDKIRTALLAVAAERVRADLASGEGRQALVNEVKAEVAGSPQIEAHRQSVRRDLAKQWTAEVEAELKEQIIQEEADREAGFMAEYSERRYTEYDMQQWRASKRRELESIWVNETDKSLAEATESEDLRAVLAEQVAIRTAKLEKETQAESLLVTFEGRGLDTTQLQAGDSLIVYFGETVEEETSDFVYSSPTRGRKMPPTKKSGAIYSRMMQFEAVGADGLFNVRSDSSADSDNPYERGQALQPGAQVALGRRLIIAGRPQRDPFITARNIAVIDTEPSSVETFTEIPVPVATISLNSVQPKGVDFVRAKA